MGTEKRKGEHVGVCTSNSVEPENKSTWLESVDMVQPVHDALPEIDLKDIDTSTELFGKKLSFPLVIAAMTGGYEGAEKINKTLAKAAEELGLGFGLGSQRAMIENPELAYTYEVRDVAPSTLVIGNIGVPQLNEASKIFDAVKSIGADVLAVHLNPLQEVTQAEGEPNFKGALANIQSLASQSPVPVIAKETGAGISKETAEKLLKAGVNGIDIGGAGGTSFAMVESLREKSLDKTFWGWGIPTAASILEVRAASKGIPLIATGGIRSGLDAAKCIALGANACGVALPLLKSAQEGYGKLIKYLSAFIENFKKSMFLVGASNLEKLKQKQCVLQGGLKEWADQRKLI